MLKANTTKTSKFYAKHHFFRNRLKINILYNPVGYS